MTVSSDGTTEYNYRSGKYESYNTTLVFGNVLRVKYDFDEDEKVLRFTQASVGIGNRRILNASLYELDKTVLASRIMQDDAQYLTEQMLESFTVAQITEFVNLAVDNNATQCTAALLDYKNKHFADYGAFDAFTLDW